MSGGEPSQELAGRVAIVTGASRGIGRAVAAMAAARGAALVLVGRDPASLDRAAAEIAGGRVRTVAGDASDAAVAARAVEEAISAYGAVDIVLNIAGAYPTALIGDTTDALYEETVSTNLRTTFMMCRAALAAMRERGGTIVNMSSTAARFPTPGLAVYGAAKAGVEAMTRALAIEAAPKVRINAVSAGPTLTDAVRALVASDTTGAVAAVTAALPLQRMAEPDEIAEAVLFLASDRASAITGQVLHVNSGGHMA